MQTEPFRETSKPLLRPRQMEDLTEEVTRMETLLSAPEHVAKGIDRRAAVKRLRSLKRDIDTQAPQSYNQKQVDDAVKRSGILLEQITQGMPTQEEMRRNPAGAVDKHRGWERRNKKKIEEWKNIQLRLHATGGADRLADESDVANLERYRPRGGAQQLNLHNEQIQGKQFYFPSGPIVAGNVMTDEEREAGERDTMATMQRLAAGSGPKAAAYKKALSLLELAAGVAETSSGNDTGDDQGGLPLETISPSGDE